MTSSPLFMFFLGMPCSGKSSVRAEVRRWVERETAVGLEEVDDFHELAQIFEADRQHDRHVPTADGGVEIVDPSVWSDLNAYLNLKLADLLEAGVVALVEFARGRYVPALSSFDPRVLDKALFVYVRCSWATAWARNLARRQDDPTRYISRAQTESTFASDDYDELRHWAGDRLVTIENDTEDLATLEQEVRLKLLPRVKTLLGLTGS